MSRKHPVQNLTAKLMQFHPSCLRTPFFQVSAKFHDVTHSKNFEDLEKAMDHFFPLCSVPDCHVELFRSNNLIRELLAVNTAPATIKKG